MRHHTVHTELFCCRMLQDWDQNQNTGPGRLGSDHAHLKHHQNKTQLVKVVLIRAVAKNVLDLFIFARRRPARCHGFVTVAVIAVVLNPCHYSVFFDSCFILKKTNDTGTRTELDFSLLLHVSPARDVMSINKTRFTLHLRCDLCHNQLRGEA